MPETTVKNDVFEFEQPCPIRDVLDRVGDLWSLLVLEALETRTLRFNELLREIGDISKQMLSRTLKRLEKDGFILRTIFPEVPPRVEYRLTDLGRSFLVPMQTLITWADSHHRPFVRLAMRMTGKMNSIAQLLSQPQNRSYVGPNLDRRP